MRTLSIPQFAVFRAITHTIQFTESVHHPNFRNLREQSISEGLRTQHTKTATNALSSIHTTTFVHNSNNFLNSVINLGNDFVCEGLKSLVFHKIILLSLYMTLSYMVQAKATNFLIANTSGFRVHYRVQWQDFCTANFKTRPHYTIKMINGSCNNFLS